MVQRINSFQPFGNALRDTEKTEQKTIKLNGFQHATDVLVKRVRRAREGRDTKEKIRAL